MISLLIILILSVGICYSNPDAKRLYDDLLSNYNRLIRPVSNNTDTVVVKLGLRLSQLIDLVRDTHTHVYPVTYKFVCNVPCKLNVCNFLISSLMKSIYHLQNLKDQILTTNVWLEHVSIVNTQVLNQYQREFEEL